jgi:hypothetical protein
MTVTRLEDLKRLRPDRVEIEEAALALYRAVRSFLAADHELHLADQAATQPRMQKAGNRLFMAKARLRAAAETYASAGMSDE